MYKKHSIAILCLLCAVSFTMLGATLFATEVSPAVADAPTVSDTSAITMQVSSEAISSIASEISSAASSKAASSKKEVSSKAVSSKSKVTPKNQPDDYIPEINDKMQKIPENLMQESATSSETVSSKKTSTSSKKAVSSKATSSKKTSSKTSSKKTSSKVASSKPASSKPASSKVPSSSGSTEAEEILYISVNGEVKAMSALDAVAQNVAAEMDDSYEAEALKAQAVAAHTYIVYSNAQGNAPVLPIRTPSENIKKLVASVLDKLIYYDNKPINAVYFAMSGGYTADAKDVWGGDIAYLKSVESKYDPLVKNYKVEKTYTQEAFQSIIAEKCGITLSGAAANWVKILTRTSGDYVGNISIGGKTKATVNGKSRTLTGYLLRDSILSYGIRSTKFDYSVKDNNVVFTTYGYGHGVGMSQAGANQYAKREGRDYKWILQHYYTGVTIK